MLLLLLLFVIVCKKSCSNTTEHRIHHCIYTLHTYHMRYHVLTDQGQREYMEDRHAVSRVHTHDDHHVCAVFDGHSGYELADYSSTNLKNILKEILDGNDLNADSVNTERNPNDIARALKATFERIDHSAQQKMPASSAGTTACAVYITSKSIITINVGDSRAILYSGSESTFDLSRDHKPSDKDEEDRIMRSGGFVTQPEKGDGVHRVMGRLSLSRALGDWEMRPWVSATPDVTIRPRSTSDEFVVLATDGVWDVMSSAEVNKMLKSRLMKGQRHRQAMNAVLTECRRRGSGDNITIVIADISSSGSSSSSSVRNHNHNNNDFDNSLNNNKKFRHSSYIL